MAENLLIYVDRLPEPRPHMVLAERSHTTMGGTSAGKAMNLRHLGADVILCTVVAADEPGDRVVGRLRAAGVRVQATVVDEGATERHVNVMSSLGERLSIYLSPPPSASVPVSAMRDLVGGADAMVVDLADHARPYLAVARDLDVPVWCDVHDYDGAAAFHAEFVDAATYLFLSADRLPDPRPFMQHRIDAGARLVVCTRGAAGAIALDGAQRWYEVPAVAVDDVVDTNGAGDAFLAGFLVAHLGKAQTGDALQAAATHAARCVRSPELWPIA